MSVLLKQPATWPHVNLNPEPMWNSSDPESVERLYSEWFVPQAWPIPPLGHQRPRGHE